MINLNDSRRYSFHRYFKCYGTDLTGEQVRALCLRFAEDETQAERFRNATSVDDDRDYNSLAWLAVEFETIGSIKTVVG